MRKSLVIKSGPASDTGFQLDPGESMHHQRGRGGVADSHLAKTNHIARRIREFFRKFLSP